MMTVTVTNILKYHYTIFTRFSLMSLCLFITIYLINYVFILARDIQRLTVTLMLYNQLNNLPIFLQ